MKLISILIPTFNPSKLIKNCIESIFNQKINHDLVEVILIDDNSSKKIYINSLRKKFKKLKYYKNSRNLGPGLSRNLGIKKSQGKYILFLDSDDFLKKNSLKKIINIINTENSDLIFFDFCIINKHKIEYYSNFYKFKFSNNKILKLLLSASADSSVIFSLYKKKFLIKNKIYFKTGLHEDILFMFKVFFFCKTKFYIKDYLYRKVNFQKSIINSISKKRISNYFSAFQELKQFARDNIRNDLNHKKLILSGESGYTYEMIYFVIKREKSIKRSINLLNFIYEKTNLLFNLENLYPKTYKDKFVSFYLSKFPQIKKKLDYHRFKRDILDLNEKT